MMVVIFMVCVVLMRWWSHFLVMEREFFLVKEYQVDVACNHESRHGHILVLHIFQSKNMAWEIVHYFPSRKIINLPLGFWKPKNVTFQKS
jgi:hypothetical protein